MVLAQHRLAPDLEHAVEAVGAWGKGRRDPLGNRVETEGVIAAGEDDALFAALPPSSWVAPLT